MPLGVNKEYNILSSIYACTRTGWRGQQVKKPRMIYVRASSCISAVPYDIQLKCNLMPTRRSPDIKAWANLQMGTGKGAGACNIPQQPCMNLWRLFQHKLLKYIN